MPRTKATPQRHPAATTVVSESGGAAASSHAAQQDEDGEEVEADLDNYHPSERRAGGSSSEAMAVLGQLLEEELGQKRKKKAPAGSSSARKKPRDEEEEEEGGGKDKGKKKSPAKKKTSGGAFEGEQTLDEMVISYVLVEGPSMANMGEHRHKQIMAAARVDAVCGRAKKVNIEVDNKSGGRARLIVNFTGNRKQFEEDLPLYNREEVIQVFQKVMTKQSTSRRKVGASSTIFSLDEVATRSPPLFWSIFEVSRNGNIVQELKDMVQEAEARNADTAA